MGLDPPTPFRTRAHACARRRRLWDSLPVVKVRMLSRGKDDEILGAVIVADSVDVVDVLRRQQQATKDAFHHKTMFEHIVSVSSTVRMVWSSDEDITLNVRTPTSPRRMRGTASSHVVSAPSVLAPLPFAIPNWSSAATRARRRRLIKGCAAAIMPTRKTLSIQHISATT